MSAIWLLGLGASVGYLLFKREVLSTSLEAAVAAHESKQAPPGPASGATFQDVRSAWRDTSDSRNLDFDERLPTSDREALLRHAESYQKEAQHFDAANGSPPVQGVYLEPAF